MIKSLLTIITILLSACASFDQTNIRPGQRVPGPGFSFTVPTETAWFAAVYGTSNRIKLVQLNDKDSYSIQASLNRGPYRGMYPNGEAHLNAFRSHKHREIQPAGFKLKEHESELAKQYGELCVRYSSVATDSRGRGTMGAAHVELISLSCAHPVLNNVLITFEISRRYDKDAAAIDLGPYAEELFSSIEYYSPD